MNEPRNEILDVLTARATWYRDGCDGLEDRDGYYASGDCARDAAHDLEAALSEIRVLERVISRLRFSEAVDEVFRRHEAPALVAERDR